MWLFRVIMLVLVCIIVISTVKWVVNELKRSGMVVSKKAKQKHEDVLKHIAMREHELDLLPHVDSNVTAVCEECRASRIQAAIVVNKFNELERKRLKQEEMLNKAVIAFAQYHMTPNEIRDLRECSVDPRPEEISYSRRHITGTDYKPGQRPDPGMIREW